MKGSLNNRDKDALMVLSSEEIHQLLTYYIREIFARRRYARVHVYPTTNNGKFVEFYDGEFEVDDYVFRIWDNKLCVQKNCKTIGECETNTKLMGWLFLLLEYVLDQCHIKELRRIYIHYEL